MRDILTVAEFTVKEAIKRKSFRISMLIIIGIIIIGFNVPNMINYFSSPNDNKEKMLKCKIKLDFAVIAKYNRRKELLIRQNKGRVRDTLPLFVTMDAFLSMFRG